MIIENILVAIALIVSAWLLVKTIKRSAKHLCMESSKWISIKKRSPENDIVVSVLFDEDDEATAHYHDHRFWGRRQSSMTISGITHWRYRDFPGGRRGIYDRRRLNTDVRLPDDQRSEDDRRTWARIK